MTSKRKRSSRRDRREPVRHPITVRPRADRGDDRRSARGADGKLPRAPHFEPVMFGMLEKVGPEVVPLYAALAVVHAEMSGAPPQACVPICYQLAGALQHLGFDAEVMAACATVVYRDEQETKLGDVGLWDRPPVVRPDGTTNGHAVLWAGSFRRLVDPTIVQAPKLLERAHDDVTFTLPVVLPVAGRQQLLSAGAVATPKGPFLISWMLFPDWIEGFAPALQRGDVAAALPYGSLLLAHACRDVLQELGQHRSDLRQLHSLYPRLGEVLAGRRPLPELPAEPPAAFLRIRRAAQGDPATG